MTMETMNSIDNFLMMIVAAKSKLTEQNVETPYLMLFDRELSEMAESAVKSNGVLIDINDRDVIDLCSNSYAIIGTLYEMTMAIIIDECNFKDYFD